jgi:hypothetical protein
MGWYGVDFDGTLVETMPPGQYEHGKHGAPIMPMIDKVNDLLGSGKEVRIFTARADYHTGLAEIKNVSKDLFAIDEFCKKYFHQRLKVTAIKDYEMIELWDDRARGVVVNTGEFAVDVIKAGMRENK